ncbi:MAG: hypothetical protein JO260_09115 [Acidobacteria bacterium]|nr:hypothetical protein [Acidobacteriota bacterium]
MRRALRAEIAVVARVVVGVVLAMVLASTPLAAAPGAELRPATNAAYDRYVALTDQRNNHELQTGEHLLWIDALSAADRSKAYADLQQGQVKMSKLDTRENGAEILVPDGMIHHWVGLAFIPGAHVDDVLAILEDYNHHSTYYTPDVERSKIESRDGDHFRVLLRFRRHKVVTVVLDTEHDVRYFRDSPTLGHSRSATVRISQVDNPGKKDEHKRPPGNDDGFLWRMDTWWRVVERDGGVYVQSEVASLTRDIPTGVAWLVRPFVTSIPEESLAFTMEATRKAVETRMPQAK